MEYLNRIEITGLRLPLIKPGDDVAWLIVKCAEEAGAGICDGDVVVITEKVLSKAMGRMVDIGSIKPSKGALRLSMKTGLDPRFIELVMRECDRILLTVPIRDLVEGGAVDLMSLAGDREAAERLLEEYPSSFIVERGGMLWSDSGIDSSNAPPGMYMFPLVDHDEIARRMHERIMELTGKYVAVVICDTELFLKGSMDFARGCYGLDPVDRSFGLPDLYGKPKYGGMDLVAHELCSAAALLFKQTREGIPVAIIRGVKYSRCGRTLKGSLPHIDYEKVFASTIRATIKTLGVKRFIKLLIKVLFSIF
jgi:coenzyme F420-0:L-glutamate ligase/coenzyme F420-1:gamma-L-glutamate ligase